MMRQVGNSYEAHAEHTNPICAMEDFGIKKLSPAPRSDKHMQGNVKSSRLRLPKVSIVQTAGQAKRKLVQRKKVSCKNLGGARKVLNDSLDGAETNRRV